MKFTLSPLKKMLKKHWRLLLVLIVVLILSFYLYRTYYLEGNTSEPESESEPEPESESEPVPVPGPEPKPITNLTDREQQAAERIKEDLLKTYYGVEENQGNSEENVDFSEAINRLKNLSQ
jgi:flagellar biosynthesis/type III secretory pathway M-ring protein FliF/YscJ